MRKKSQYTSLMADGPVRGKTLADLYIAVRADAGLPALEKTQVIQQIEGMTRGAPPSTPLSSLVTRGLGGVIGTLIARYFGMGATGQLVAAVAGYGLGTKIDKYLNTPPDPYPGWRFPGH